MICCPNRRKEHCKVENFTKIILKIGILNEVIHFFHGVFHT